MYNLSSRTISAAMLLTTVLLLAACGNNGKNQISDPKAAEASSEVQNQDVSGINVSTEFKGAIGQYHQYVIDQTDSFVKETTAFVNAVNAGDIDKAKQLYAPARAYYERIEPIAESLGDFDPWIDAREGDVPESEWRGYHKLEKLLWVDQSVSGQSAIANQLLQDVKQLRVKVEGVEIDVPMLVTGAVELLNEVSSSKVTGEEERYSHTDLYDFAANVDGAAEIFKVLQPAVKAKNPDLEAEITKRFGELDAELSPFRKDNSYILYTDLKEEEIKKLSQAIDALAEPLSQVGTVVEE